VTSRDDEDEDTTTRFGARPSGAPRGDREQRLAIVAAGLDAFADRGFAATTLDDIARRADASVDAVRVLVGDKDAFVVAYHLDRMVAFEVVGATSAAMPLAERLPYVFHQQIGGIARHRRWLAEIAQRFVDPSDPVSVFGPNHNELMARGRDVLVRILAGTLSGDELQGVAGALRMVLVSLLLVFIHDDDDGDDGAATHALIDDLFGELIPRLRLLATSEGRTKLLAMPGGVRFLATVIGALRRSGISALPR